MSSANPAIEYAQCYALCRAWELLTTRMAVLWMCEGMCGTSIGVVFGEEIYHSISPK